jgi:3',5'-cyclic AMP phosphodiesterase CpdA
MTDWSKKQLGPVPRVEGDGIMSLKDIIGADGVDAIQKLGEIRFHALGDSGVSHAEEAEKVAEDMATDYKPGAASLNPAFLFHLGDVINCLENPGFLEGDGGNDSSQLDWLKKTLKSISSKKSNKALIIATHHPPYSSAGHSGSTEMSQSIDAICSAARVVPDAFLSGHAHNYQRYTRRIGGKQVPYIVIGTGGIATQKVPDATGQPADASHETTYDAAIASYGYLYVTASAKELKFEFWPLTDGHHVQPYDPFTVDLGTHILTRG